MKDIDKVIILYIIITGRIPSDKYVLFLSKIQDIVKITEHIYISNKSILRYKFAENDIGENCKELLNYVNIIQDKKVNLYQTIKNFVILQKTSEMYIRMKLWKEMDITKYHPFNNDECLQMIRMNFPSDIYLAYVKLVPGAFKSDLWRLCALYLNGGLYVDSHIKPIHKHIEHILKIPDYIFCIDYPCSPNYIYNAFMMAPKKSWLIKEIIYEIVNNVKNEYYPDRDLEITGPGLHGKIIKRLLKINKFTEGFQIYNDEKYLFLSHKPIKTIFKYKDINKLKYNLTLSNEIICTCRYDTYRYELTNICNQLHYSDLFKQHKVYDSTIYIS